MILFGLLLSVLHRSRAAARGVVVLHQLRESMSLISAYAASQDGHMPCKPVAPTSPPGQMVQLLLPDGSWVAVPYFAQMSMWHAVLAAHWREPVDIGFAPRSMSIAIEGTSPYWKRPSDFELSQAFYASSEFWDASADQSMFMTRRVRLTEVRFPSSKGLLAHQMPRSTGVSPVRWHDVRDTTTSVVFVDGHARAARVGQFITPATNHLYLGLQAPVLTTESGHRGRDL